MHDEENVVIAGRNPVIEALKSGGELEKIHISKGAVGSVIKIAAMAKERGVPVHYVEKQILDKMDTGSHQGVVAFLSAYRYCEIEDIMELAYIRREDPFIVILSGIEDPQNLGAIIRTAEAAGVHGLIIPKRRAAGLTAAVMKASAGALSHMLCARVPNIAQAIDKLKGMGFWIYACDTGGELYHVKILTGGIGLVIGGEGSGVGRLIREKCDSVLSIPMKGEIKSLNASNAAAILMYEVRRQRDGK